MNVIRHRTAITRYEFSRPVKIAIQDSILTHNESFFDYGCGKGDDIRELEKLDYNAKGWDPYFAPNNPHVESAIVNLGFILNVIENPTERAESLQNAFNLAKEALIVSVMLDSSSNKATYLQEHSDGFLTSRNTFQKYYTQVEARDYIKEVLGIEPLAADVGVFYVFKKEELKQQYIDKRGRRRIQFTRRTRLTLADKYEIHRELLEDFTNTIYDLGRIPAEDEYDRSKELKEKVGSFRKTYSIIQALFPDNVIEERKQFRHYELYTQMALSRFWGRPKRKFLPLSIQRDIKTFFGTYKTAKEKGDALLFLAGDMQYINNAIKKTEIGKILPEDFYIHRDCLELLNPVLQVFVGCANVLAGELPEANILKISRIKKKVSFLVYPDFDANPHPALAQSFKINLERQTIRTINFNESANPPILHRKELFVDPEYPGYEKFGKLTEKEDKLGLLEDSTKIGNKEQWEKRLKEKGCEIKGHRVFNLK